jgi:opacity protein-like surface antigen
MKKLVVISAVSALLVLLASPAFAADVSVEVIGKAELLNGSSGEIAKDGVDANGIDKYAVPDLGTAYAIPRVRIAASGQTENGVIGGWLRFDAGYYSYGFGGLNEELAKNSIPLELGDIGFAYLTPSGFVWWKPADVFKLQIGTNGGDGEFGLEGVTGWGFYALACETIIDNGNVWGGGYTGINSRFRNAFYGGFTGPGAIFTITPIEALVFNIGIPINGDSASSVYRKITAQITYDIEGAGKAGITFIGDMTEDGLNADGDAPNNDNPSLYAYFNLTAVENFSLDIGIGYKFFDTYTNTTTVPNPGNPDIVTKTTMTINNPLAIGLGVSLKYDIFGFNARLITEFLGSLKGETGVNGVSTSDSLDGGFNLLFDILPSFDINDNLTIYLSAGLGVTVGAESMDITDPVNPKKVTADPLIGWHVQPYVVVTPNYWSGSFFAGVRLEQSINKDNGGGGSQYLNWSIPIGITCSF